MDKIIDTTISTQNKNYNCKVVIMNFNGKKEVCLYVDFESCISKIEISDYSFKKEQFEETYIDFINRVL